MTEQTINVVALVADPSILTFYKTDGSVFTITQGDPRGQAMADEFLAQQELGKEVITLIIGEDAKTATHLTSEKRSPLIRFFRALASDVKKLFGAETFDPTLTEEQHEAAAAKVRAVAARLFSSDKDRTPETTDGDDLPVRMVQSEAPLGKDETIIAVTADGIVPGVESLSDQYAAADEGKAPTNGADNLLIRLAKISDKRGHTGTELLQFVQKIDLPILDDGSFFAYKRLLHQGDGVYVDPHSKQVHQRIGDVVQMDESLVDKSRRTQCSQGLHVGTRHYMGGFHKDSPGSGTCLVLVQPEDVIAVPTYQNTKMRACRYTLIADLSNKAHDLVNNGKRVDDCPDTMKLLAELVAGARPPMLGTANIGGGYGSNLTYTLNGQDVKTNITLEDARALCKRSGSVPSKPVTPVRTIKDEIQGNRAGMPAEKVRTKDAVMKPADIAKRGAEAQAVAASGGSVRVQIAAQLYGRMTDKANTDEDRRKAALDLKDHKQKTKVSYAALGLPAKAGDEVQEILDIVPATPMQKAADGLTAKPKAEPKKPTPAPSKAPEPKKTEPVKAAPQPKAPAKVEAKPEPKAEAPKGTRQERARGLWSTIMNDKSLANRQKAARELRAFKKSAKVGWGALGLGNYDVETKLNTLLD